MIITRTDRSQAPLTKLEALSLSKLKTARKRRLSNVSTCPGTQTLSSWRVWTPSS